MTQKALAKITDRTEMVGTNRFEVLLFSLGNQQKYGVNVYKVRDVTNYKPLTKIASCHPAIAGLFHSRNHTLPVVDLSLAIGLPATSAKTKPSIITMEYNRHTHAVLVDSVDRLVELSWQDVCPPPKAAGPNTYICAIVEINGQLVEIIDIEKIFDEILGAQQELPSHDPIQTEPGKEKHVVVVDDSRVALNQIKRLLDEMHIKHTCFKDGQSAIEYLCEWENSEDHKHPIDLIISDIEMPLKDGYTLTTEIAQHTGLSGLPVVLHSSISGGFSRERAKKCGAAGFTAKFDPVELSAVIRNHIL